MKHPSDFAICISSYLTKHLAGTRNLSSNTIKSYRDTFCLLLLFMKEMNKKIDRICLVDIDADLVIRFLDWLEVNRGNSASTRNVRLAAIHAFFRYVQFQNPEMLLHCQRILAIPMKETEKRFVEYLPEQALRELLSLPDQTKKYGIRDTALLCLLYDSGARVQELIDLSLLDIRLETPATIRLYGKGRKVRVVPLMSQTATILQKYLNMWHLDAARKPDDPVFVNHQGKRLTRPGVTYILNKYMAQVSWMEGKKGITPHIIRHPLQIVHSGDLQRPSKTSTSKIPKSPCYAPSGSSKLFPCAVMISRMVFRTNRFVSSSGSVMSSQSSSMS